MNTCATCQWMQPYAAGKPEEGGECMVDPPVVAVVRNSVVTLRPSVLATDRCSEWYGGSSIEYDSGDAWLTLTGEPVIVKEKES